MSWLGGQYLTSNAYIAGQRARFKKELEERETYIEVAGMLLSEGAEQPLPVLESLLNRTCYLASIGQNHTLLQMLHSGFYGPINRGELPRFMAEVEHSQAIVDRIDTVIAQALAGSDVIGGFTDQGLPSDPNGQHHPSVFIGGNVFNDWGGGNGHASTAAWRTQFEASAAQPPVPEGDQSVMDIIKLIGMLPTLLADIQKYLPVIEAAVKAVQTLAGQMPHADAVAATVNHLTPGQPNAPGLNG